MRLSPRVIAVFAAGAVMLSLSKPHAAGSQAPQDPRITLDLRQELAKLKPGETIRVIIRMKSQLLPEARARVLTEAGDQRSPKNKITRRKALVRVLRAHADSSQQVLRPIMRDLQAQGMVTRVRYLWLSSVVTAEINPRALDAILRDEGIAYIKQDVPRPTLQFLQTPTWGVTQIHADAVWALPTPYTGQGVVVGMIDTGIDLTHPDLVKRLWINPGEDINHDGQFTAADNNGVDDDGNGYVDDVVGWDLANNDNGPTDWNGHGTHVAGTVAGDGTGGTATGVAPGARLMALAYSANVNAGQAEAWEGMQYALDNGADIVSFSSGWKDSWAPDYVTWRTNAEALIDGGVLFVVAAGNDNPHVAAPGDVLTPARVPRVVAVGATDNTDAIASFSGNGPTSWQTVAGYTDYIWPPGLLKPDVAAPGVSITSTQNGGGYVNTATWSGTSMATPHVSGLAALLLQKDPSLQPHELAFLIRQTAVDLGTAGPDNVFGYGRVDALAAVNYAYSRTPAYDLSVTGTNDVWTTADIWVDNDDDGVPNDPIANQNNHLYARIRNIGGGAVGNVEVKFYYADVGTIGISGFDPNNDGDPADGNFNYIGSYFVPVVGPAGTAQATAVAVVNWNVPVPVTDHWCVGIGIVAHNPPNPAEVVRTNNRAFKNFFNIVVAQSEMRAFRFFVYPNPRRPGAPFDLEFARRGLPRDYEIALGIDERLAKRWLQRAEGFEVERHVALKNLPIEGDSALQAVNLRLTGERGVLRGIIAPDSERVLVTLLVRGPRRVPRVAPKAGAAQLLVVNTRDEGGTFGGFAVKIVQRRAPVVRRP